MRQSLIDFLKANPIFQIRSISEEILTSVAAAVLFDPCSFSLIPKIAVEAKRIKMVLTKKNRPFFQTLKKYVNFLDRDPIFGAYPLERFNFFMIDREYPLFFSSNH